MANTPEVAPRGLASGARIHARVLSLGGLHLEMELELLIELVVLPVRREKTLETTQEPSGCQHAGLKPSGGCA
jgi:hypothetical protein